MAELGKVKVRILKYVGHHQPGDVVEVDEATAKHLCTVAVLDDGVVKQEHRRAILLDTWEKLQKAPIDKAVVTQGELNAVGMKNTVETPKDAAFDAEMARLSQPLKKKKGEKESA